MIGVRIGLMMMIPSVGVGVGGRRMMTGMVRIGLTRVISGTGVKVHVGGTGVKVQVGGTGVKVQVGGTRVGGMRVGVGVALEIGRAHV